MSGYPAGSHVEVACSEVVIKQDGDSLVSISTQTPDETDLVQINVPIDELLQRIDAFTHFKRQQIDASNQIEFCQRTSNDASCARTAAAYVRQSTSHVSHITTTKVHNTTGPTPKPLPPVDQLKHDLQPPTSPWIRASITRGGPSSSLLGLAERVGNMEQYTNLYDGGLTPRDLIQRVHHLENRLLQLEGRSHEYQQNTATKAMKSVPRVDSRKMSIHRPKPHPQLPLDVT